MYLPNVIYLSILKVQLILSALLMSNAAYSCYRAMDIIKLGWLENSSCSVHFDAQGLMSLLLSAAMPPYRAQRLKLLRLLARSDS